MIILNTAFNNLKKNMLINIFSVLQLVIVFLLTFFMVSSVFLRYKYYEPFKDYFSSDGFYYYYNGYTTEKNTAENLDVAISEETLLSKIKKSDSIISCYTGMLFDPENNCNFKNIAYDDEILKRYAPELSEGRWIEITDDPNEVEVVISDNDYGWKIGDVITLASVNDPSECTFKAKVVGKIKDGSQVIGAGFFAENNINYTNFYYPYSFKTEGRTLMLFSSTALNNIKVDFPIEHDSAVLQSIAYSGVITLSDVANEEEMEDIQAILNQNGYSVTCNLEEFNRNSINYILKQIKILLPIIIVLIIMVFVSSISISSISTRTRLKDFAIYYINGLQWKQCIFVNMMQSIIISTISVITSMILIIAIKSTSLVSNISIVFNQYTICSIFLIIILYIINSMLMPTIIIGKNTPKQILTR